MRKNQILLGVLFFVLFGCHTIDSSTQKSDKSTIDHQNKKFEKISNQFYKDDQGKIYVKTRSLINPPEDYGNEFYREVPIADYKSYKRLSGNYYAKDKLHVYKVWANTNGKYIEILNEADPKTFEVIFYRLGKDKNHVFYNGKIIPELNVDSLTVLCQKISDESTTAYGLMKDHQHVFYQNKKMKGIDAKSFECIQQKPGVLYQDKNWIYKNGYFTSMDTTQKVKR